MIKKFFLNDEHGSWDDELKENNITEVDTTVAALEKCKYVAMVMTNNFTKKSSAKYPIVIISDGDWSEVVATLNEYNHPICGRVNSKADAESIAEWVDDVGPDTKMLAIVFGDAGEPEDGIIVVYKQ